MKKIGLILFLCTFLVSCASITRPSGPSPEVGDFAPDFNVMDVSGKEIRLSDFKEKKNVALVFYESYL
jgi:peroxiredoxin